MGFLPFDVSYLVFTPRRVRLPGEPPKSPSSPSKSGAVNSHSLRLRSHASPKSKSFRSLMGVKSSSNLSTLAKEKGKEVTGEPVA